MKNDFLKNVRRDREIEEVLPPLLHDDYELLEKSILEEGFNTKFGRIFVWFPNNNVFRPGYIVDGYARYDICQKHGIKLECKNFETLFFNTKEEAIKWRYENQLRRRNLSDVDKYEVLRRYEELIGKKIVPDDEVLSPEQQLKLIDGRLSEIDECVSRLAAEKNEYIDKRNQVFKEAGFETKLQYEFVPNEFVPWLRDCQFFEDFKGRKKIYLTCDVTKEAEPGDVCFLGIPQNLKLEFKMLWKRAHDEEIQRRYMQEEDVRRKMSQQQMSEGGMTVTMNVNGHNRKYLKEFCRILTKRFHPDNPDGDGQAMQYVNELKRLWGV